ncbi:MAG: hypothetical protein HYU29_04135 [Chloroflexi bacterium]|nr:hypothetical protein [Chloroflexota bacterium]
MRAQRSGPKSKPELGAKMRLGLVVFGVLMAIEIIEYLVGTSVRAGAWPFLAILAAIGAWPIVRYFMHIPQLWQREE